MDKFLVLKNYDMYMEAIADSYPQLDRLCVEVLKGLESHGGEATTSELRDVTSAERGYLILYRVDGKLEEEGYVESFQPDGGAGENPPREITLTDEGREVLKDILEAESDSPHREIGERLESVEDQLESLQSRLGEIENDDMSQDVDTDIQKQITAIADGVNDLESRVETIEENAIFNSEMQAQLNSAIWMGSVAKDLLSEEFGEERVMEMVNEKMGQFEEFDRN